MIVVKVKASSVLNDRQAWAIGVARELLALVAERRNMRHCLLLRMDGSTSIRRWHPTQSEFGDELVGVYDSRATIIAIAEDLLATLDSRRRIIEVATPHA